MQGAAGYSSAQKVQMLWLCDIQSMRKRAGGYLQALRESRNIFETLQTDFSEESAWFQARPLQDVCAAGHHSDEIETSPMADSIYGHSMSYVPQGQQPRMPCQSSAEIGVVVILHRNYFWNSGENTRHGTLKSEGSMMSIS